jgi:hypothetical protein
MEGYLGHMEQLKLSADEIKIHKLGNVVGTISRLPKWPILQPIVTRTKCAHTCAATCYAPCIPLLCWLHIYTTARGHAHQVHPRFGKGRSFHDLHCHMYASCICVHSTGSTLVIVGCILAIEGG